MASRQFYSSLANYFQRALSFDVSLYTDMIDQMYEICEEDQAVLEDLENRYNKDLEIISQKYNLEKDPNPTDYGTKMKDALLSIFKDKYNEGEALALGCVSEAYISYKKNWLNKDEYYEIRDMFVPFNLPISVEMLNVEEFVNVFTSMNEVNENGQYTFVLLKKVGKTVIDRTVSLDEIKDAINELNFDEAW